MQIICIGESKNIFMDNVILIQFNAKSETNISIKSPINFDITNLKTNTSQCYKTAEANFPALIQFPAR